MACIFRFNFIKAEHDNIFITLYENKYSFILIFVLNVICVLYIMTTKKSCRKNFFLNDDTISKLYMRTLKSTIVPRLNILLTSKPKQCILNFIDYFTRSMSGAKYSY